MWSSLSKRGIAGLAAVMMLVANVMMPAQAVFADGPGKVFVCKYVSTPGVSEVPSHIISVSVANKDYKPGDLFVDAQGLSYVLEFDTGQEEPSITECPTYISPPAMPSYLDPCNPIDNPTVSNIEWGSYEDTEYYYWVLNNDGSVTAYAREGYYFKTSDSTYSSTVSFGLPADSGVVCEAEKIVIPAGLSSVDPCGLDNASLVTDPLDAIENISYKVNDNGSVSVMAVDGYVLTVNGTTTYSTYVYDAPTDSGELCEVLSEEPEFVDNCGTLNDYYIVRETDKIAYYVDGEVIAAGKYYVNDASEVTVIAKVTDDDYEITNRDSYSYKFTDEPCAADVELKADAWCYGVDTVVEAILTNDTDSRQAYQVAVSDADGELASEVVVLQPGESERVQKMVAGDGEFTISVYSYNDSERGELLSEKTVETECVDDFTPMIYKKNQDGKILSGGKFNVKVCQWLDSIHALRVVDEEDPCAVYDDVYFGTDGQWFVDNVEYKMNVYTTVTITESVAPQGCQPAGPWEFIWKRTTDDREVRAFLPDGPTVGSWNTADGSNVFNLENECDEPGQGGDTPTTTTPEPTEPTLADTGASQTALLAIAGAMMLASVGFAVSPKLLRRNEA